MSKLTAGDRVKIVKGCQSLGITKGTTALVASVTEMGAEFGYGVKISFKFMNGSLSGQTRTMWARHPNRLEDSVIRTNNGNPLKVVEFSKV